MLRIIRTPEKSDGFGRVRTRELGYKRPAYLRNISHLPLFCRLHHLPPDVACILALAVFLASTLLWYGVGGRKVGMVGSRWPA